MQQPLSFEMKLGAGFSATILAPISICVMALYGLNESIKSNHIVMSDYVQDLILAGRLGVEEESRVAAGRGFLITGDRIYLDRMNATRESFLKDLAILQRSDISAPHDQLLSELKIAEDSYQQTLSKIVQARVAGEGLKDLTRSFEDRLQPKRENLQTSVNNYVVYAREQLENGKKGLSEANDAIFHLVLAVSLIALALAGAMAITITKVLSKLYREIQDTAKMREEIVEMVAHDLRNPITAVSLSTQFLLKMANSGNAIDSDDLRCRTENIKRATDHVNSLIRSLLDVARMKSGTLSIERASVSPRDILEDLFELFNNIAQEKGVTLEVQQDSLLLVQCDFERMVQVFSNLIGNALKFSASNQKITFGAHRRAGAVVFFVTDQGPGISEGEQPFVFERYWQAGSHKRTGVGLGLAICKDIVVAHGGKIWLESKIGFGTTFYFSIPIDKIASKKPPQRSEVVFG